MEEKYKELLDSLLENLQNTVCLDFNKSIDENEKGIENLSKEQDEELLKQLRTLAYIENILHYKELVILDFSLGDFYGMSSGEFLLLIGKLRYKSSSKQVKRKDLKKIRDHLENVKSNNKSFTNLDKLVYMILVLHTTNKYKYSCVLIRVLYTQYNMYLTKYS